MTTAINIPWTAALAPDAKLQEVPHEQAFGPMHVPCPQDVSHVTKKSNSQKILNHILDVAYIVDNNSQNNHLYNCTH